MADDIFVSNDIELNADFGEVFVIDQGVVTKVIANKYNPTQTYDVGDYVINVDKLYKCITAVVEPEEFDNTKWENVKLANEMQIANANIALKANADSVYDKTAIDNKITTINNALALKANSDDVYAKADTYNKTEVDNALDTKADADTTYSKTEVDDALALKADSSSVYSKTDTDTLLNAKADKSTTYTKTEVDTALANKANSADVYTKTETYSKTEVDTDIYKKTETYNKTEVDNKIANLPTPMQFKGTLGTGGTISDLPTASVSNEGFTYKVITDGTYASISAKVGDMFTSNGNEWVHIPSGDETFTDTWRGIKVNGTEQLGSSINTGSVDFKNGTNSTAVFDPSDSSIKFNVDGYTQAQVDAKLADKANASDVYAKSETYSQSEVDSKLLVKANSSDVYTKQETYTKTEVNTALSEKADTSAVTTALALKADKADTYTKEEVNDKFDEIDPIGTASGRIATFETNLADVLQSLKCEINASGGYDADTQTAHPLVGHSELNLTRCGVNVLPYNPLAQNSSISGVEGDFTVTSANGFSCANFNITNLKGLGTFYFSGEGERSQSYSSPIAFQLVYFYDGSYHFEALGNYDNNNKCKVTNIAFTLPNNTEFAYLQCYVNNTDDDSHGETANFKNIIISTTQNSNFEPYNGQTFTIAFGQTVYGGVYDKSGRLTITHGIKDLGTLNYNYDSDTPRFWTNEITDIKHPSNNAIAINGLADIYKVVSFDDLYYRYKENGTIACSAAGVVSIINTAYTDAPTFKTAMSGHYLCYELATPIVIDVPSISVFAENGVNNVFSDTGDTEVEYTKGSMAKDIKTLIGTTKFADLSDIPNPPATDGNYRLIVTITDGKPTYSWEEITE